MVQKQNVSHVFWNTCSVCTFRIFSGPITVQSQFPFFNPQMCKSDFLFTSGPMTLIYKPSPRNDSVFAR